MPMRLQGYVPAPLFSFMQKTKHGLIPKNYVALLGDSYAIGEGDEWEQMKDDWENKGFGLGYRLFKSTGRDYFVFAQGGVGSLGGLLAKPISSLKYLNKTFLYKIQEPQAIVVCFYEGNDLNDNIHELRDKFEGEYDIGKLRHKDYFDHFIEKKIIGENYLARSSENFHWDSNLFFLQMMGNLVDHFYKNIANVQKTKINPKKWTPPQINRTIVKKTEIRLPDFLQSPSLELSEAEINIGVYIFGQSLAYLQKLFPNAEIFIVYIPSPLASYHLTSTQVTIHRYWARNYIYDVDFVMQRSDFICSKIKEEAKKAGVVFIDTRAKIRSASEKHLIHGPLDWKHFNHYGYDALAEAITPYLTEQIRH
jgi:hypothetical protein